MATCSACTGPAVLHARYSGRHMCSEHFLRFFQQRAKSEVKRQGGLPEGRIAVALSGGKDSVSLLHFLHAMTQKHRGTELVAVSVHEGIAGYRDGALEICRDVTRRLDVEWHVVHTKDLGGYTIDAYAAGEAGPTGTATRTAAAGTGTVTAEKASAVTANKTAPAATGSPRAACGPCGVFRRQGINQEAARLGAAAVATGHNLDDQAQTVLMNVLGGDLARLERLAPHARPQPGMVPRIIPFRTIPEKEVLLYAMLNGLPVHDEMECPYAKRAQRFLLRDMLWDLEARQPGTRHRLLRFHEKVKQRAPETSEPAGACALCRGPTSGTTCKSCAWSAD